MSSKISNQIEISNFAGVISIGENAAYFPNRKYLSSTSSLADENGLGEQISPSTDQIDKSF